LPMAQTKGPPGLIPYRKRQKSGHQKRILTIPPTPELLAQKAREQCRTPARANPHQSSDPIDLLFFHGRITYGQFRAGGKFAYLRYVVWGRPRQTAGLSKAIHEHISSDDAPDVMLTDDEKAEKREREEWAYNRAVACLKLNPRHLEALQQLVVDGLKPDRLLQARAIAAMETLRRLWKIPEDLDDDWQA
jgi:hypothetical protein